jgi:DNA-binding MarR family transcriptional regulator
MENPRSAENTSPPSPIGPAANHAFYQAENYLPEHSVGYLMRLILTSLAHSVEAEMAGSALTNAQWLPILKLSMGQASTAAELARDCQLDAGAMTRMLDRLEAKGLCSRSRSERDRRLVHIALTESGKRAAQALPQVLSNVLNSHLAGMSPQEFETLKYLLQKMLSNAPNLHGKSWPLPHGNVLEK